MIARAANKRRSERRQRGFTLVELLVAMVAGLMVALAVIALGRDATNTFQDEARSAAAEMSVRLGKERLRNDLEHAGMLSTGTIARDPQVARLQGDMPNVGAPAAPTNPAVQNHLGLKNLVSIRLGTGFSASSFNLGNDGTDQAGFAYSANNGLNPDGIEVSGSMTTVDEFMGVIQQPPAAGGCAARIYLNPQDPAVIRLMQDPTGVAYSNAQITANLLAIFHPVPTMNASGFGLRIANTVNTQYQFAMVGVLCGFPGVGVDTSTVPNRPFVEVQDQLLTQSNSSGGIVGSGNNDVAVNAVQVVRWHIRRKAQAILDGPLNATNAARFELVRTWVPMDVGPFADTVAAPACVVGGQNVCDEIVSEFAVDLKFGFSVVTPPANNTITTFDIDTGAVNNQAWAPRTGFVANNQGPHLIRGIRFRMAVRSSFPDRKTNLPAYPNFLYRYCTDPVAIAGCTNFARVRTTVEDVFLMNQANMSTPPY
jgi:prepilin-type N-terminal cleavage/methylation domain-containing protein